METVGMRRVNFACVLDGDDPFMQGDLLQARVQEGCLAAGCPAGDENVLSLRHRRPDEFYPPLRRVEVSRIAIGALSALGARRMQVCWMRRPVRQRHIVEGLPTNGERDRVRLHCWRVDNLYAVSAGERPRKERVLFADQLLGVLGGEAGELFQVIECEPGHLVPFHRVSDFEPHLAGTVDGELAHAVPLQEIHERRREGLEGDGAQCAT